MYISYDKKGCINKHDKHTIILAMVMGGGGMIKIEGDKRE